MASVELVYSGAHDAVRVEDPELGVIGTYERGVPISVGDDDGQIPPAIANSLLHQDTWSQAKPAPVKKGDN